MTTRDDEMEFDMLDWAVAGPADDVWTATLGELAPSRVDTAGRMTEDVGTREKLAAVVSVVTAVTSVLESHGFRVAVVERPKHVDVVYEDLGSTQADRIHLGHELANVASAGSVVPVDTGVAGPGVVRVHLDDEPCDDVPACPCVAMRRCSCGSSGCARCDAPTVPMSRGDDFGGGVDLGEPTSSFDLDVWDDDEEELLFDDDEILALF